MRSDYKACRHPAVGSRRIVHKFLWWPKTLPITEGNNVCQRRWLESTAWLEERDYYNDCSEMG